MQGFLNSHIIILTFPPLLGCGIYICPCPDVCCLESVSSATPKVKVIETYTLFIKYMLACELTYLGCYCPIFQGQGHTIMWTKNQLCVQL